jgi:hypothetical protein
MPKVRKAQPRDALEFGENLRSADIRGIELIADIPPLVALLAPFQNPQPKQLYTVVHAKRPLAMFGVSQSRKKTANRIGIPWFLGADELFENHLKFFVRESNFCLSRLGDSFDILENYVSVENKVHLYWVGRMGFEKAKYISDYGISKSPFWKSEKYGIWNMDVGQFVSTTPFQASVPNYISLVVIWVFLLWSGNLMCSQYNERLCRNSTPAHVAPKTRC